MIRSIYFFKFLLVSTLISGTLAMEGSLENASTQSSQVKRLEQFTTPKEMIDYGELLEELFDQEKYEDVLHLAYPPPTIEIPGTSSLSDVERYLYARAMALSKTFHALAEREQLNPQSAIVFLQKAWPPIQNYLESFDNFHSKHAPVSYRICYHKLIIYYRAGCYFFELFRLGGANQRKEEVLPVLPNAINSWEATIDQVDKFSKIATREDWESIQNWLPDIQFELLSAYCSLVQVDSKLSLKRAKDLAHLLQRGPRAEEARKTIELTEQILERKALEAKPLGSKKVEVLRTQKLANLQARIIRQAEALPGDTEQPLQLTVQSEIALLDALHIDLAHQFPQISESLRKIEGLITKELMKSTPEEIPPSLLDIYTSFQALLGGDALIQKGWMYLSHFILGGDIEEGIARAEILIMLEKSKCGTVSYKNRFICAALRNLSGDHDEWVALVSELNAKAEAEKVKKKKAKKTQKVRRADHRRNLIKETLQQREAEDLERQSKQSQQAISASQRVKKELKVPQTTDIYSPGSSVVVSLEQQQKEQRERHQAAVAKRAAQPAAVFVTAPAIVPVTRVLSKEEQLDLALENCNETFLDLYPNLTSGCKAVIREIEENNWKFTRTQFKAFLKSIGCIINSNGTSHQKAQLPKGDIVTLNGELITILNDFGGALTLPDWDQDFVHHYLRKQIRIAIKSLKVIALKGRNAKEQIKDVNN